MNIQMLDMIHLPTQKCLLELYSTLFSNGSPLTLMVYMWLRAGQTAL